MMRVTREQLMSVAPVPIPSLQDIASRAIADYVADSPAGERGDALDSIADAAYPAVLREIVATKLAQKGSLASGELSKLLSGGISTLDLSEAQSEAFDNLMFDQVWATERAVTAILLNSTVLTQSMYRLIIYAQVMHPPSAALLQELSLSYCEQLSDPVMESVCTSFPNLRALVIPFCPSLSEKALPEISRASFRESLTHLDYSHNTSPLSGLRCLENIPGLRRLYASHLKGFEDFTPPSLICLEYMDISGMSCVSSFNMCKMISFSIHNLTELSLTESSIHSSDLDAFTSGLLEPLPLVRLDLSWCEELSAESISNFASLCLNLTSLSLQSTKMNSVSIQNIVRHCNSLEILNLSRCVDIDNEALVCIASHCQLKSLDISWAPVGSDGLLFFLTRSERLQVLCLQGCKTIDLAVMDRLMGLPDARGVVMPLHLKFLDLSWVNICSEQHARSISKAWPGLFVVDYYLQGFADGEMIVDDFY